MPLQGTFDILDFTEVMTLLSDKQATGRLQLRTSGAAAKLFFEDGRVTGLDGGEHQAAARVSSSSDDAHARLDEACFEFLDAERGAFEFQPGLPPSASPQLSLPVDVLLERVRRQLEEWRRIQAVVPSMEAQPRIVAEISKDEVTLNRIGWRLLAAIDGRRSVSTIARVVGVSPYEACRILKSLIEEGVVDLGNNRPVVAIAPPGGANPGVRLRLGEDETEEPEGRPAPAGAAAEGGLAKAQATEEAVVEPSGGREGAANGSGSAGDDPDTSTQPKRTPSLLRIRSRTGGPSIEEASSS